MKSGLCIWTFPFFGEGKGVNPRLERLLHKKAASGEKVLHGARFTEQKQIDGPPCTKGLSIINWLLKIIHGIIGRENKIFQVEVF